MADNVEQFKCLYERYFDRTVAFIMSLGRSKGDAEDLAQETFFRVYRSMDSYRREAEWAFIQTTARRLMLNMIRDQQALKRKVSLAADEEIYGVADQQPSPEELAAIRETVEAAHAAVKELSQPKRQCLLLFLGGHRYGEIGQILGISEDTVKSRLHEARRDLKGKGIELPWSKNPGGTSSTAG